MTVIEHSPAPDEILDFIDDSVRRLREAGSPAQFIVVGPHSYEAMSEAVAARFRRSAGRFETYAHLPIVVDPARDHRVVVLPAAPDAASEANLVSTS